MKNPIHPPSRVILDPTSGIRAGHFFNSRVMSHSSCQSIESQSSHIPNIFDGTDFLNWKSKMEFYLKSVNIKCWNVVIHGFDSVDITFNTRAMKIIFDYLNTEQFNLICHCLSAQEI